MTERWDRDSPDPAYLGGDQFAYWLVMLATPEDLEAAIPRLEECGEHGASHLAMVRDELQRRRRTAAFVD